MRTTFACREFTDDPVEDATLHHILDVARFAPSGGNRQGQHVIVVKDAALRTQLGRLCKPTFAVYLEQVAAGESPWNTVDATSIDEDSVWATGAEVPMRFLDNIAGVPALLVVCVDLSVVASFDRHLPRVGVISGASIYPFVWNILLAARNVGLGGVLTTFLAGQEAQAQSLLHLPEHYAVAAMVPLGHPVKQLTKLRRAPVVDFTTVNSFDGPALSAPNSR